MVYSNEEAYDTIQIANECEGNYRQSARLWRERFPDRTPRSMNVFGRLLKRVKNEGVVQPHHNKGKQIFRPVRDVREADIIASALVHPNDSLHRREVDSGVSISTIRRILKDFQFHPFKMIYINKLYPADHESRLEFCNWIRQQPRNFHHKILFTDECTFKSDGEINHQNFRYWSQENPRWVREADHQRIWKVNVWCGMIHNQIIGPFFFEGNLNGALYSDFLQENLPLLLEDVPELLRQEMWFQQDACPAHTSLIARATLNAQFTDRWIGKHGPINYPARSPDLTALDYYLWGRLKDLVYRERPITREDMKDRIRHAIRSISAEEILKAINHFQPAVEACIEKNGAQFEHL